MKSVSNKWYMLIACFITLGLLCTFGQTNPAQPESQGAQQVGRQDPFEDSQKPAPTAAEPVTLSTPEKAPVEKPDLFMETVVLRFLRAANLEPVVKSMLTEFGRVSVDKETNSLIVCDSQKKLNNILDQIRKADRIPQQIRIETVIVDVKLDDQTDVGVNWENLLGNSSQSNFSSQQTLIDELGGSMTNPGINLGYASGGIDASLNALQTTRDVEILANPIVMVVSGQEATIETIEEIPYTELTQSTGGVGSTDAITSTQFKNVGLTLTVKAIITDENRILMTIEPQQSINTGVAGVGNSEVPVVDKRRTKTTLLMEDKQVLIMGGLRTKATRITKNKVPLLGDLPLLGFLFSADSKQQQHSELLVFISPQISDKETLTDYQKSRLKQTRDLPPVIIDNKVRPEFQIMKSATDALSNTIQPQK